MKAIGRISLMNIRMALIATALIMIGYGAYRGEVETVLGKAIKICLECIGVG